MSCITAPVMVRQSPGAAVLTAGDVTSPTIYWFKAYEAASFPEVLTARDYFAIWSTDHAIGDGGLRWGDFDNLDLSDFSERGLIWDAADTRAAGGPVTALQTETPWLVRCPTDPNGRTLYLYFHEKGPAGGAGDQETRMISSAGGALHLAAWTYEGTVMPCDANTNNTGYAVVERRAVADWHAWTQTKYTGIGMIHWTSADGIAWVATDPWLDPEWPIIEPDRRFSFGKTAITYNGRAWWFGKSANIVSGGGSATDGRISMGAAPSDTLVVQPVYDLRVPDTSLGESENVRNASLLRVGDTGHIYWQSDQNLWYETVDLS